MSVESASVEILLETLMERFETLRTQRPKKMRVPMQAEIRSLDFWRSIVAECLASFFLIFIVCGSFIPWSGHSPPSIGIALAAGFAVASLTLTFAHISGAHLNPVVSLALLVTRRISPMKAFLFMTSQGGGAIAGAALLYGVTRSGYQGNLGATVISSGLSEWQALAIELSLSFVIVLVYLTAMDDQRTVLPASIGPGPLTLGLTYAACSFVALPSTGASFNPMRSLGPAFVMNKWDSHWIYWLGPIVGGCLAGILYEFIFNPYRNDNLRKGSIDGDSSSIHSDEDNYDDVKSTVANYHSARSQHYDQYRPPISPAALPSAALSPGGVAGNNWRNQRMERAESVYGGTKSLYCKSPAVARRASLNRSQSVYSKTPGSVVSVPMNQLIGAGGRMQPAQSTYLARNVDLIRTDSIYASRPSPPMPATRAESVYGHQTKPLRHACDTTDASIHSPRSAGAGNNPRSPREREPIYGTASSEYSVHSGRSNKPESFQLEPVYDTRPDTSVKCAGATQRNDSVYSRKMTPMTSNYAMAPPMSSPMGPPMAPPMGPPMGPPSALPRTELETSNHSSAPLSPSDTSKDSAYGSVHGNVNQITVDSTYGSVRATATSEWTSSATESAHNQLNYNHQHNATNVFNMAPYLHQHNQQQQQQQQQQIYGQKFRADLLSPASRHSPTSGAFHSPVQY